MKKGGLGVFFLLSAAGLTAQQTTEFSPGWISYLNARQGLYTRFTAGTEGYAGSLSFTPLYTVIPGYLRLGLTASLHYSGQRVNAQAGPSITYRIKTWNAGLFGSAANLQVVMAHVWSGRNQPAVGGGICAELLNRIRMGPSVHHGYRQNEWWFQFETGWRIRSPRKKTEAFNQ